MAGLPSPLNALRNKLRLRHRAFLPWLRRRGDISRASAPDDLPVEVVIPAIDRDLPSLPVVVEGARRNIAHRLMAIHIVAPATPAILAFCQQHDCHFVDEAHVLPISLRDITFAPRGMDRSGWIFQQLLKLAADSYCQTEHMLILDADTILTHAQSFWRDGAPIFRISDELHRPYYRSLNRLLKQDWRPYFSFVSHHMPFTAEALAALRSEIERQAPGKPWYQTVLDSLDPDQISGFSEYEMFGQFWIHSPRPYRLEYWRNTSALRNDLLDVEGIEQVYGPRFKSVSFHAHLQ